MICESCDGDGFFEIDRSYQQCGMLIERWYCEKCEKCNGTGTIDEPLLDNCTNSNNTEDQNDTSQQS